MESWGGCSSVGLECGGRGGSGGGGGGGAGAGAGAGATCGGCL